MEQLKRKITYSVIRYSPDALKGEIINVGLLFYNSIDKKVKYFILDEKSPKIKAVMSNNTEDNIYKSYKEMLEFYLEKSKADISGMVGQIYIASYYEEDFVQKMYEYYRDKELTFSEPNIAYTKNEDKLFHTILKRYVGSCNIDIDRTSTMTAKKYMKQIFSSNENLNKRIKSDVIVRPIKELDDFEIKIDFSFKNGKWNYIQTIPRISTANKNSDWFSKMSLILDGNTEEKSKIHLIYKKSDFIEDTSTYHLLKYLKNKYSGLEIHDADKEKEINNLCEYIEKEGQILDDVV